MKPLSFKAQLNLLKRCISRDLNLEKELKAHGLTYDNLQYGKNVIQDNLFADNSAFAEYKSLNQYRADNHGIPAVSFFLGVAAWIWDLNMQAFKILRQLS